jgi:cytidylate kinase
MDTMMHQDLRFAAAAERQMRTWSRVEELAALAASGKAGESPTTSSIAYVAISREAGAQGTTVGLTVSERLGWEDFDRNLLDQVAQRYKESRLMLDLVDETTSNWVFDVLGSWMDHQVITHEKYVTQMSRLIQLLARRGPAVFVGRGAQFLLPRARTVCVRIVASEPYRVERVQQRFGFEKRGALHWVRQVDRGRSEFVQRFFHRDVADPHLYDAVFNVERLGTDAVARHIVELVRRGPRPQAEAESAVAAK